MSKNKNKKNEFVYKIFVDGSNSNQAKTVDKKYLRKGGIGIYHPDSGTKISEKFPFKNSTNNKAELWVCIRALQWVKSITNKKNKNNIGIILFSDSSYVIDSMTKWLPGWKKRGWKKSDGNDVLNKEFITQLDELLHYFPKTKFMKVKAHKRKPKNEYDIWLWNGNKIADELAVRGRKLCN